MRSVTLLNIAFVLLNNVQSCSVQAPSTGTKYIQNVRLLADVDKILLTMKEDSSEYCEEMDARDGTLIETGCDDQGIRDWAIPEIDPANTIVDEVKITAIESKKSTGLLELSMSRNQVRSISTSIPLKNIDSSNVNYRFFSIDSLHAAFIIVQEREQASHELIVIQFASQTDNTIIHSANIGSLIGFDSYSLDNMRWDNFKVYDYGKVFIQTRFLSDCYPTLGYLTLEQDDNGFITEVAFTKMDSGHDFLDSAAERVYTYQTVGQYINVFDIESAQINTLDAINGGHRINPSMEPTKYPSMMPTVYRALNAPLEQNAAPLEPQIKTTQHLNDGSSVPVSPAADDNQSLLIFVAIICGLVAFCFTAFFCFVMRKGRAIDDEDPVVPKMGVTALATTSETVLSGCGSDSSGVVVYAYNDEPTQPPSAPSEEVELWLKELELQQYTSNFKQNGFASLEMLKIISADQELIDIGINDKYHRDVLLQKILKMNTENNDFRQISMDVDNIVIDSDDQNYDTNGQIIPTIPTIPTIPEYPPQKSMDVDNIVIETDAIEAYMETHEEVKYVENNLNFMQM